MNNIDKNSTRFSAKTIFVSAVLVAGLVAGAIYVTLTPDGNDETQTVLPFDQGMREELRPFATGEMAALFVSEDVSNRNSLGFQNRAGEDISVADWQGRIVLVNLWATWCPPCRAEMPALDQLQAQLGGADFEVVAINVDRGGPGKGEAFYTEIGLNNLRFYYDGSQPGIVRELSVIGMPTTLLLDRQGREVARLAGPAEWASEDAVKLIEAAIGADQ
ncbi:MAG: TlpA family protein disulfide reductase [Rhizobiales bacterium]|nr:TlpA family protein disulfide reductase [Hyphomicrobiales bacterium]